MKQKAYTIDNASLLFLSLMQKNHTNAFRFTMTLTEEVCPETLQAAVDRMYRRFPTIIARFRAGFFHSHFRIRWTAVQVPSSLRAV